MKAVITISKKFFALHFKAGEPTNFKHKVLEGEKIHTCRANYPYWDHKIKRLKEAGGVLSLREWSDAPYRSRQDIIMEVPADSVGVQRLVISKAHFNNCVFLGATVDGVPAIIEDIASHDGLSLEEFSAWFVPLIGGGESIELAIIHFTNYRY